MSREHQDEFVVCSCDEDQRGSLISKLKSCGAVNPEEGVCMIIKTSLLVLLFNIIDSIVKQFEFTNAKYCVVKFSVGREVGLTIKVLKAFSVSQLTC